MDVQNEEERRKVEALWEYQTEGVTFEGVKVEMIRDFWLVSFLFVFNPYIIIRSYVVENNASSTLIVI